MDGWTGHREERVKGAPSKAAAGEMEPGLLSVTTHVGRGEA